MAGYMGFGMQKWIYNRKLRKPFNIQKRPTCNTINNYQRKFKLQPSKNNDIVPFFLSLFILTTFLLIMVTKKSDFENYISNRNSQISLKEERESNMAFNFLLKSGSSRLASKNYKGAYSEFMLALKIKPNHNEARELLLETVQLICENDNTLCKDLDFNDKLGFEN